MLIYLITVRPYIEKRLNRIEIYNELTVLFCSWHLFLYTELVPDALMCYYLGWSIVLFTLLNLVINIGIVIVMNLLELKN